MRSRTNCSVAGTTRFPSKADGLALWCEGTSPTTPCREIAGRFAPFAPRRPDTGARRSGAAASVTDSTGNEWTALPADGSRLRVCSTPIPKCALAFVLKAGAQCGSSARWDLSGGPPARAVPTATPLHVYTGDVTRPGEAGGLAFDLGGPAPGLTLQWPGTRRRWRDERPTSACVLMAREPSPLAT